MQQQNKPKDQQFKGGRSYFGSQLEGVQSIVLRKAQGNK